MTYSNLVDHKNISYKRSTGILYLNILLYMVTFLVSIIPTFTSKDMDFIILIPIILLILILLIPGLTLFYIIPRSQKKRKELSAKINELYGDSIIKDHYIVTLPNTKKLTPFQKIISFIGFIILMYVISFILYSFILTNSLYIATMAIVSGTSLTYMLFLMFRYTHYELIFTDTHIIYNFTKAYTYESISKFQFIKSIKKGYFLDINAGTAYIQVFVAEDKKSFIENRFITAT